MADSVPSPYPDPGNLRRIPVDLFASKNFSSHSAGDLAFADSSGNLLFFVRKSSSSLKSVFDSSGVLLFSITRPHSGKWEVHKGDLEKQELVLTAKRASNRFSKVELEVSFAGQGSTEPRHLVIKGCPFQKSCTIYSQDSIVAQTSLMYKLKQIYVGRSKFRLTIFPGSVDHPLVVALVAVFLDGRK
ncbi:PREDICTED: protein LURP-one-related 7 [Tarenaya hassleriana]|uniref:protein LURP-one-related 7 n=1 Tax=Tarenaya hassleriana TaxID=28532 RepID=UPI00053C8444|nr:PREDICTED: protein LURP-one-related 7 [Tarenaya hassleriana]XP_010521982.1 PREDICTED: protein LURP-one-related 7 [Tarenaya hassleriana]